MSQNHQLPLEAGLKLEGKVSDSYEQKEATSTSTPKATATIQAKITPVPMQMEMQMQHKYIGQEQSVLEQQRNRVALDNQFRASPNTIAMNTQNNLFSPTLNFVPTTPVNGQRPIQIFNPMMTPQMQNMNHHNGGNMSSPQMQYNGGNMSSPQMQFPLAQSQSQSPGYVVRPFIQQQPQQQSVPPSEMYLARQKEMLVKHLMQAKATGTATAGQLAQLQQMVQSRQMQNMQQMQLQQRMLAAAAQSRATAPTSSPPMQRPVVPQQQRPTPQQIHQMQMLRNQQRAQSSGGRSTAAPQPASASTAGHGTRRLGPPVNTYAPRIKKGGTSLITYVPPPDARPVRKGRFAEDYSSAESESDPEYSDSEGGSEEYNRQRNAARLQKSAQRAQAASMEVAPYRPRKRTRMLINTKHEFEKLPLYQFEHIAGKTEILVPITLEIDLDPTYKYYDTFSWNLNETEMSPSKFAEYLCEDVNVNQQLHRKNIVRSILTQLEEFKKFYLHVDVPIPQDTRTIIRLDITVGKIQLRDRFEWDLASDLSPEEFASILVQDLQLGGEFVTLIAHSIREQLFKVKTGSDFDALLSFAIEKPLRAEEEAKSWSPFIDCGDRDEEEDAQIDQDRSNRLLRRQLRVNQTNRTRGQFSRGYLLINDSVGPPAPILTAGQIPITNAIPAEERDAWKCSHCLVKYSSNLVVMNGPAGENTLCRSCGLYYIGQDGLPSHRLKMFA